MIDGQIFIDAYTDEECSKAFDHYYSLVNAMDWDSRMIEAVKSLYFIRVSEDGRMNFIDGRIF